jgi:hypothetical protein
LELESIFADRALRGIGPRPLNHGWIVGRNCRIGSLVQQPLRQTKERRVDVRLPLVCDGFGFLVRTLHEPHARAKLVHPLDVAFGAMERRLQRDTHVAVLLLPECLEDIQRHLRPGRVLHVDPDKKLMAPGRLEDAAQVVDTGGAVDAGAKLRELQRDVPLDSRCDDDVEQPDVRACGRVGFLRGADALTEVIERDMQSLALDASRGVNGFFNVFAGDEAPREAVARSHPVLRRQPFERGAS